MSWNISFRAADKAEAKTKLEEAAEQAKGGLPVEVETMIDGAIDFLPDCTDSFILVSSFGHFHTGEGRGGSNMTIKIENCFNETPAA